MLILLYMKIFLWGCKWINFYLNISEFIFIYIGACNYKNILMHFYKSVFLCEYMWIIFMWIYVNIKYFLNICLCIFMWMYFFVKICNVFFCENMLIYFFVMWMHAFVFEFLCNYVLFGSFWNIPIIMSRKRQ